MLFSGGDMGENYADAALRHWHDAQLLESAQRIENADQLYGLAAECAIKKALSLVLDKHIDELWGRTRNCQNVPVLLRAVLAGPSDTKKHNPFKDWKIGQRYGSNGDIASTAMEAHRDAAADVLRAVGLLGSRKP